VLSEHPHDPDILPDEKQSLLLLSPLQKESSQASQTLVFEHLGVVPEQ